MTKAVFQLEPLTCPSCINKIEATLKRTAGIHSAKVLFNFSKVKAEFDSTQIDVNSMEEIIRKLGYPVLSSKIS